MGWKNVWVVESLTPGLRSLLCDLPETQFSQPQNGNGKSYLFSFSPSKGSLLDTPPHHPPTVKSHCGYAVLVTERREVLSKPVFPALVESPAMGMPLWTEHLPSPPPPRSDGAGKAVSAPEGSLSEWENLESSRLLCVPPPAPPRTVRSECEVSPKPHTSSHIGGPAGAPGGAPGAPTWVRGPQRPWASGVQGARCCMGSSCPGGGG